MAKTSLSDPLQTKFEAHWFWEERPGISWNLLSLSSVFELHVVVRGTLTDA